MFATLCDNKTGNKIGGAYYSLEEAIEARKQLGLEKSANILVMHAPNRWGIYLEPETK